MVGGISKGMWPKGFFARKILLQNRHGWALGNYHKVTNQDKSCKGRDRRCLTEARVPSFNGGGRSIKNPPLRHFECISRHNTTFLPVEA